MLNYDYYIILVLTMMSLLLFFGAHMIFGLIPKKLRHSPFERSRKTLGWAYLVVAFTTFGFFGLDVGYVPPRFSIAINLVCYNLVTSLISISFMILISHNKELGKLYKQTIASCIIYPIPLIIALLFNSETTNYIVEILSAIYLFYIIVRYTINIFQNYNKAIKNGDDYYSEDINIHISWIKRGVLSFIAVGTLSCLAAFATFAPYWMLIIYLIFTIGIFIYVFEKFNNFMIIFMEIDDEILEENEESTIIHDIEEITAQNSINTDNNIEVNIEEWINKKGYCQKRLTIQSVANEAFTNRSYMSNHINMKYNCTFRMWVSKLRIEEAKRIMLETKDKKLTLTIIADMVGFASLGSFTHTFASLEGSSPSKWFENEISK